MMIDYCKTCVHAVDMEDFCDNCYYCGMLNDRGIAPTGYEEAKKQINADRFRAMSDMEIASFFYWDVDGSGKTQWQWLDWLRQECAE